LVPTSSSAAAPQPTHKQELEKDNKRRIIRLQLAETAYLERIQNEPHNPMWERQLGAMLAHMERRKHARGNPTRIEQINQELEEQIKEESDEERDHRHDPLEEQQLLNLISSWTFGEGESSPYDSDKPRDVARQHAQAEITYRFTPSVDDTSSEEELKDKLEEIKAKIKTHVIAPLSDEQYVHLYRTPESPNRNKEPTTSAGDHPYLNIFNPGHRYLFWA
ncbi:hypothetical protein Brms1b_012140, partial [Colletotrichum noveboracense]